MIIQTPLGAGREFDLIRELCRRWGPRAAGIGDDAAVLSCPAGESLVVTTDTSVENRHFRRDWLTPREIGYRSTVAAISDIAAMAATPTAMLVTLSFPASSAGVIGEVGEGIGEAAERFGVLIVGGDLSAASELSVSVTVLGTSASPVRRSGVRHGMAIYVTGALGGPGAAVRAWLDGREPSAAARERFARPVPRLREARWLAQRGARAMIDISDGLTGDVGHLAAASDLRIAIELDALLCVPGVSPGDAARSGEEYELAVAAAPDLDTELFARELGVPLSRVGRVVAGPPGVDLYLGGDRVASTGGFSHF